MWRPFQGITLGPIHPLTQLLAQFCCLCWCCLMAFRGERMPADLLSLQVARACVGTSNHILQVPGEGLQARVSPQLTFFSWRISTFSSVNSTRTSERSGGDIIWNLMDCSQLFRLGVAVQSPTAMGIYFVRSCLDYKRINGEGDFLCLSDFWTASVNSVSPDNCCAWLFFRSY